jgi:hypothetical protein
MCLGRVIPRPTPDTAEEDSQLTIPCCAYAKGYPPLAEVAFAALLRLPEVGMSLVGNVLVTGST